MSVSCGLCGISGPDVAMALVEWRDATTKTPWEAMPRCKDHVRCRDRVVAIGESWDVLDGQRGGRIMPGPVDEPAIAEGEAQW